MLHVEQKDSSIALTFSPDSEDIDAAIQRFRMFLRNVRILRPSNFVVVMQELLANVPNQGKNWSENGIVRITAHRIVGSKLSIVVEVEGERFNWKTLAGGDIEDRQPCKRKRKALIDALADSVEFDSADSRVIIVVSEG